MLNSEDNNKNIQVVFLLLRKANAQMTQIQVQNRKKKCVNYEFSLAAFFLAWVIVTCLPNVSLSDAEFRGQ